MLPYLMSYKVNSQVGNEVIETDIGYTVRYRPEFGGDYGYIYKGDPSVPDSTNMCSYKIQKAYQESGISENNPLNQSGFYVDFGYNTLYKLASDISDISPYIDMQISDNFALRIGLINKGEQDEGIYVDFLQQDYREAGLERVFGFIGVDSTGNPIYDYSHCIICWKTGNTYLPQVYGNAALTLFSVDNPAPGNNTPGDLGDFRFMWISTPYSDSDTFRDYPLIYTLPYITNTTLYNREHPELGKSINRGIGFIFQSIAYDSENPNRQEFLQASEEDAEGSYWFYKGMFYRQTSEPPPYEGGSGGNGDYDNTTDPVPLPDKPSITPIATKFLSMYKIDKNNINTLGGFLWSKDFFDNFNKIFASPIESIVSLQAVRYRDLQGDVVPVYLAGLDTGATGVKITEGTYVLDCGNVQITSYYDTFLDYNPYTTYKLFLPYVGFVNLDADIITNTNLHLQYYIDMLTGQGVALLHITSNSGLDGVMYNFPCQCSVSIPYTGSSYAQFFSAALSVASGLNNVNAVMQSAKSNKKTKNNGHNYALDMGLAVADGIMDAKYEVQQSGGGGGSISGYLGVQNPYIVVQRPTELYPKKYRNYYGLPTFNTSRLGKIEGYAKIADIHLDGIPNITQTEQDELLSLLQGGVYF